MGMDISGFVECRAWHLHEQGGAAGWQAAIDLFLLNTTRNYDAFGCLFGMRNYANFLPLAAGRGMPSDASETVRAELAQLAPWPDQAYGVTWITWAELAAADWDEPAERADCRIHRYRRTEDGLRYIGKSSWDARFTRAVGLPDPVPGQAQAWPEGTEWLVGDTFYRAERLRRRDAVPADGAWKPVWAVMEALASLHGDENVRLVVWFDD